MDNKIVKVIFEEGWETMYNSDLTQGDYGQVLQIEGITLPDGNVEVHFSLTEHNGEAPISIGNVKDNVITVDIPDFILAKENEYNSSYEAYAWIYVTDGDSGRTIRKIVFIIDTRAKSTTNVPEAQQDQFLQEVRQVMAETKEIAQSVRDDADNGEFDGEKGEKGDAGSIKFVIVPTLPAEDIDTSVIYLVPTESETEQNKFLEYIYVDGSWECIGSASVEVNLDDYAKNEIATTIYNANGKYEATAGLFKYDGNSNGGLFKSTAGGDTQETFRIKKADHTTIDNRTPSNYHDAGIHGGNHCQPITPAVLDYAVKKALSDCKLTGDNVWTDEEKAKALELLGVILSVGATKDTVVLRDGDGRIYTQTPKFDSHATTKKYVDDLIAELRTEIEALKG